MIDGVHNIYSICMENKVSWEMKPTALTSEGWGQQHLFMRGGVHSIYTKEMKPTAYRVHSIYSWEKEYTTCTYERRRTRVYSWEMEYTEFIVKRWSPKQLLVRYGVHNIYSQEIESAAFSLER